MGKIEDVVQQKVAGQVAALAEMSGAERVALLASLLADDSTRHALAAAKPGAVSGILLKRAQKPQAESLLDNPAVKAAIAKMAPRMAKNQGAWIAAHATFDQTEKARRKALDDYKAARNALGRVEIRIFGQDAKVTIGEGDDTRDIKFRIATVDGKLVITTGRGSGSVAHLTQFEPGGQYCHRDKNGRIMGKMTVTTDGKFSVSLPKSAADVYNSPSSAGKAASGGQSCRGTTYWRPLD